MNKKMYLWVTLCLIAVLLAACSPVGSKADVIKCTGTLNSETELDSGDAKLVNGVEHVTGLVYSYDQESNCPELTGVLTVNVNYTDTVSSLWGTFYFETAYNGGGVLEGTFHGTNDLLKSNFSTDSTSYKGTGSLSGLQFHMITTGFNLEATLQNTASE